MESEKRKLTYKDHEKRGHVQGLVPTPEDYVNKGKPKKEYVKDHPHDPLETFWILTCHKEVEKGDDPKLHGHKKKHQILQ